MIPPCNCQPDRNPSSLGKAPTTCPEAPLEQDTPMCSTVGSVHAGVPSLLTLRTWSHKLRVFAPHPDTMVSAHSCPPGALKQREPRVSVGSDG